MYQEEKYTFAAYLSLHDTLNLNQKRKRKCLLCCSFLLCVYNFLIILHISFKYVCVVQAYYSFLSIVICGYIGLYRIVVVLLKKIIYYTYLNCSLFSILHNNNCFAHEIHDDRRLKTFCMFRSRLC